MKSTSTYRRLLPLSIAIVALSALAAQTWGQSGGRSYNRNNRPTVERQQRQTSPEQRQQRLEQVAANNQTELGLEGYCPVCIINSRKWVAGNPNVSAVYDGKTYFFPGDGPRQEFLRNPAKYVPALGGDCTVCYEKTGKRIPGNIRFGSLFNNRIYLFPSSKERDVFKKSPQDYENVDLAINGNCIVCQVNADKTVTGKPEFTAVHDGLRYQFPSARQRSEFLATPKQYVSAIAKQSMKESMHASDTKMMNKMHTGAMKEKAMPGEGGMQKVDMKKDAIMRDTSMMMKSKKRSMEDASQIDVSGKMACAACEFGVHPLGAPEELGLAVTTDEGRVYVIEDGHRRWPELYKMRFDGKPVAVSGTVIKSAGKISWLKPTSLTAL